MMLADPQWREVRQLCEAEIARCLDELERSETGAERNRGAIAVARSVLKLANPDFEPPERRIQPEILEFEGADLPE